MVFDLSDDLIIRVVGFLPDWEHVSSLDFSVSNQVIGYIMKLPSNYSVKLNFLIGMKKLYLIELVIMYQVA